STSASLRNRLVIELSQLATTTVIHTLSLHDALPICSGRTPAFPTPAEEAQTTNPGSKSNRPWPEATTPPSTAIMTRQRRTPNSRDRKSTRLNSSHVSISYADFCLKKKKNIHKKNNHR